MPEEKKSKFAIDKKNSWLLLDNEEESNVNKYSSEYIKFLSSAKTERKAHNLAVDLAKKKGYKYLNEYEKLKSGDKVIISCMDRTVLFAHIGEKPLEEGLLIIGGHTDSPRLDTKPNPLYEDSDTAMFDTHYYGGIKKYQWVTIPLAIHATIIKPDGEKISFSIGENPEDPVFFISDLLPHLAKDQAKKSMAEGITGEGLNVTIASRPINDKDAKNKVKENVLKYLNERYGIIEEDLSSADIEIVPAGPAREAGFDKSMIIGYGHDDRICAYAGLRALIDTEEIPEKTSVVLLCDKEEIGSMGATGMDSFFFENSIAEIINLTEDNYSDIILRRCLSRSKMLSADVNSLHDPNYPDVSSPNNNMAKLGYGVVIQKYTGSRGKVHSSEASPEFTAFVKKIFNDNKVSWQTGELGKVDAGGGGTIALLMARYGMDVIDCGPGLISMHAPWEVCSKVDAYMAYKGYKAFLKSK